MMQMVISWFSSPPPSHSDISAVTPFSMQLAKNRDFLEKAWKSVSSIFASYQEEPSMKYQLLNIGDLEKNGNLKLACTTFAAFPSCLPINILQGMYRDQAEQFNKDPNKQLLFIPYVQRGWFRDHVVLFGVNKQKKEIFFYDPKGFTVKDYALCPLIEKIQEIFKEYSFFQNLKKEQADFYNCGGFVVERIKLLAQHSKETLAENVEKHPLTTEIVLQAKKSYEKP